MKRIIGYIILVLIIFIIFNIGKKVEKKVGSFNKNPYEIYISKYSKRFAVDSLLIKAVMKKESNLNPRAVSSTGAVGLMQIMPKTAREIANQLNIMNYSGKNLKEAEINIMFGTYYLKKLLNSYNNNLILALAAYNAGIGNVENWYSKDPEIEEKIYKIPFKETRAYVRSIISIYKIYHGAEKLKTFLRI
ncbi:transglycosylase SLT domain protein [Endomicrobiia bacterium]|uniref:Lytic transglycosylase n=1 Tax=Endomicrobium trichonymphae TaxID=1408204 RepID=B1H0D1_ENDTX|nr:lytic transglycosylase domain-containing protein [Candidatus Endomicrobium trichonymphae]GHT04196.1 transglycosylase SLT domain protein [Endomicrobiia bacterium]BAG13963.1 putative Lytic transglycosylase [Candidatus Endomicrobium trichonymphae]BAV58957.1 putative lytic transglycosylase [Candidatus Endomicrobium trichonymphae]GHT08284.1 transglycosylase SLT domain protein [Endomicrobiia bacterium]GHT10833.1 transglycosylase SLT domain protein [Endomicrobiia bacterium]